LGDVKEGDELPRMMKGPMTVTGFIGYAQGWGGLYTSTNKLHFQLICAHRGLGIPNKFCVRDVPERVHWDDDFAREVGPSAPMITDQSVTAC
jgi:hypothetical protein